jgi:metal-sulfur cluster biosynthetic enzyme
VHDGRVEVTISLTVPNCPMKDQTVANVQTAIRALPRVEEVKVNLTTMTDEERKSVFGELTEGMAAKYNFLLI